MAPLLDSDAAELNAFFEAAYKGDLAGVRQALLRHPQWATSSFRNEERDPQHPRTALLFAAEAGHPEVIEALLPFCDPACFEPLSPSYSPLQAAAAYGHLACLECLLPLSDPLARDDHGNTALIWAAQEGHIDCVLALLTPQAVTTTDDDGETPLMFAVRQGHLDCAQALLPLSDPNAIDLSGRNALCIAATYASSQVEGVEILRLLLPVSSMDVESPDGSCALTRIARYGPFELVGEMAARGNVLRTMPTLNGDEKESVLELLLHKAPASALRDFLPHCSEDYLAEALPGAIHTAHTRSKLDLVTVMIEFLPLHALPAALQQEKDAVILNLLTQALAHKEQAALRADLGASPHAVPRPETDTSLSGLHGAEAAETVDSNPSAPSTQTRTQTQIQPPPRAPRRRL